MARRQISIRPSCSGTQPAIRFGLREWTTPQAVHTDRGRVSPSGIRSATGAAQLGQNFIAGIVVAANDPAKGCAVSARRAVYLPLAAGRAELADAAATKSSGSEDSCAFDSPSRHQPLFHPRCDLFGHWCI